VRRVHGGAAPARAQPYEYRADQQPEAKARIAAATASLIGPSAALGIDIGTCCSAVAHALAGRDDLFVVTNSLHVAIEFRHSESKLLLTGGMLTAELSLTGGIPAETIRDVHLDNLILSCGGLTVEHGITYFDLAEAEVRRALLDKAENVILAVDHTKLGVRRAIRLEGLAVIDTLVTDQEPPADIEAELKRNGARVVVA
jgi:DeoR/GlpR family transcriptional regulator of sugar metabolism